MLLTNLSHLSSVVSIYLGILISMLLYLPNLLPPHSPPSHPSTFKLSLTSVIPILTLTSFTLRVCSAERRERKWWVTEPCMGRALPPFPDPQDITYSDLKARLWGLLSAASRFPEMMPTISWPWAQTIFLCSQKPSHHQSLANSWRAGYPHYEPRELCGPTFPFSIQLWLRREFHVHDWHTLGV